MKDLGISSKFVWILNPLNTRDAYFYRNYSMWNKCITKKYDYLTVCYFHLILKALFFSWTNGRWGFPVNFNTSVFKGNRDVDRWVQFLWKWVQRGLCTLCCFSYLCASALEKDNWLLWSYHLQRKHSVNETFSLKVSLTEWHSFLPQNKGKDFFLLSISTVSHGIPQVYLRAQWYNLENNGVRALTDGILKGWQLVAGLIHAVRFVTHDYNIYFFLQMSRRKLAIDKCFSFGAMQA